MAPESRANFKLQVENENLFHTILPKHFFLSFGFVYFILFSLRIVNGANEHTHTIYE